MPDRSSSITITRPYPNAVTNDLSSPTHTTITLPAGSTWTSGLHWHERHVEFLRVVKGTVRVWLDGDVKVLTAPSTSTAGKEEEEVVVRVERGVRHEWGRADRGIGREGEGDGEEVVVVESTEPEDGEKRAFFWCLNRVVLAAQADAMTRESEGRNDVGWMAICRTRLWKFVADIWTTLQLLVIFRNFDNFPVFWQVSDGFAAGDWYGPRAMAKILEWIVTHSVLNIAATVGWMVGVEVASQGYPPPYVSIRSTAKKVY